MVAAAAFMLRGTGWAWLLAGAGLFTVLTGVFGFCPACAMVGRKPVEPRG